MKYTLLLILFFAGYAHTDMLKLQKEEPLRGTFINHTEIKDSLIHVVSFIIGNDTITYKKSDIVITIAKSDTTYFVNGKIDINPNKSYFNITTISKEDIKEGVYRNSAEFYYNKPSLNINSIYFDTLTDTFFPKQLLIPHFYIVSNNIKIKYSKYTHGKIWGCYKNGQLYYNYHNKLKKATFQKDVMWFEALFQEGMSPYSSYKKVLYNFETNKTTIISRKGLKKILKGFDDLYNTYINLSKKEQKKQVSNFFNLYVARKLYGI